MGRLKNTKILPLQVDKKLESVVLNTRVYAMIYYDSSVYLYILYMQCTY